MKPGLMNTPFRLLALFFALVGLVGCGESSDKGAPTARHTKAHPLTSPAVSDCEPGQPGGRLTILSPAPPRTFNPVLAGDGGSESITRFLFAGLVNMDLAKEVARPGLAESWSVAADGRTWTFKLRPGLYWSDGQRLTADDVVFTWNDVMNNPEINRASFEFLQIEGKPVQVTKVDDLTVRVTTPSVFAPFIEFFGNISILPRHAMGREVAERRFLNVYSLATKPEKIVGNGPFRVKEINATAVLLERNPEFWMTDKTGRRLPYFDEVLIDFGSRKAPQQAFAEGVGDVCELTRPDDYAQFQAAFPSGKFQLLDLRAGSERDFLWFNLNTNVDRATGQPLVAPIKAKWFREKNFRQAVSCAIDRDRLVKEVYGNRAAATLTFLSNENPKWNNPNVPQFGFDLARAKQLLGGIGIQDRNGDGTLEDAEGNVIEFSILSNEGNALRQRAVIIIAEQLGKLGFKVTQKSIPYDALVQRINGTCDYECVVMGLGGGGLDPTAQLLVLKSSEPLHQWFPNQSAPGTEWEARIDFLMDAQTRTLDFAERKKHYDEVQMILAEQMPMIYTVTPLHFAVARPNLKNLRPSVISPYRLTWNVEELYFQK